MTDCLGTSYYLDCLGSYLDCPATRYLDCLGSYLDRPATRYLDCLGASYLDCPAKRYLDCLGSYLDCPATRYLDCLGADCLDCLGCGTGPATLAGCLATCRVSFGNSGSSSARRIAGAATRSGIQWCRG